MEQAEQEQKYQTDITVEQELADSDITKAYIARLPIYLHAAAKAYAKQRSISLNALIIESVRDRLDQATASIHKIVSATELYRQAELQKISEKSKVGISNTGYVPVVPSNTTGVEGDVSDAAEAAQEQVPPSSETAENADTNLRSGAEKPLTAALRAALGIKTLATIEEVEPRILGDDPAFNAGIAAAESLIATENDPEVIEQRQRLEFGREFGNQALQVILRMPAYRKTSWEKRFELAREQRERGE